MLKVWPKCCGKQYQHFKAPMEQCDAFNGGEKPFVHAPRAASASECSSDCHNSGLWDWLAHVKRSPRARPRLWTPLCWISSEWERRSRAHSCLRLLALRGPAFNVEEIKQSAFMRPGQLSHTAAHSEAVCMAVHEYSCCCLMRTLASSERWAEQLDTSVNLINEAQSCADNSWLWIAMGKIWERAKGNFLTSNRFLQPNIKASPAVCQWLKLLHAVQATSGSMWWRSASADSSSTKG